MNGRDRKCQGTGRERKGCTGRHLQRRVKLHLLRSGRLPSASFPQGDKKYIISVGHSYQSRKMILGASPTLTWDRSRAWQVCERMSRVATVGVSLPSPGQSPGFRHCYLHLCSPFSPNLRLKYVLLQHKHIISSCV